MATTWLLLTAGFAWGQQGSLSGLVRDPSGSAVPKAHILLEAKVNGARQEATTNGTGLYTLSSIPPGQYRLTADSTGLATATVEDLEIKVAAKATLDITLKLSGVATDVSVDAGAVNINTTDASVSTVVDREFVAQLPLNGRSFQSLLTLVPGVSQTISYAGTNYSGEITVNGQRTEANAYTVDGASVNIGAGHAYANGQGRGAGFGGLTPGVTALGTTQSLVSIDAMDEFRAVTSTYSAEYGRTPGGQFEFSTRAGTNNWHGSVYDYLRNGVLDANNWFNNSAGLERPAERQNDFGGTLGGPLLIPKLYNGRDRTFFFFSYEGLRLQQPAGASTADVPTVALRMNAPAVLRPYLNSFPLPNGADQGNGLALYTGSSSNPSSIDTSSVRLDHSLNERFKIFGRYSNAPSSTVLPPPYAQVETIQQNIRTLTVGMTNVLTPRIVNEARYNFSQVTAERTYQNISRDGATALAFTDIPAVGANVENGIHFNLEFGTHPQYYIQPRVVEQHSWNLIDSLTATVGRHVLKTGVDYRHIYNRQNFAFSDVNVSFFDAQEVLTNTPGYTRISYFDTPINATYPYLSLFAQDEWRTTARLSTSFGLRWDFSPAPGDSAGNLPYTVTGTDVNTLQVARRGTPLWKNTYGNFAPRVGVAYKLRDAPESSTILRAGAGLFYDTANAYASSGYSGVGTSTDIFPNGGFPFTAAQVRAQKPANNNVTAPYNGGVVGFDPNLKLPRVGQWNVALEQALGRRQTLTVNYVGSAGDRLLLVKEYSPSTGNVNFAPDSDLELTTNGASSNYNALQLRFQRNFSRGLQILSSYTWAHAIDDATQNFDVYGVMRANSDNDIRHSAQAAVTYQIPGKFSSRFARAAFAGWSLNGRFTGYSALPVNLVGNSGTDPVNGVYFNYQPDSVPGQPFYVTDGNAPGGRLINYSGFVTAPSGRQGNFSRNKLRGFSIVQTDLAVHREFPVFNEYSLEFRAEAFNLLNHPNFGAVDPYLQDGPSLFGRAASMANDALGGLGSIYQTGGPRSLQLTLRFHF